MAQRTRKTPISLGPFDLNSAARRMKVSVRQLLYYLSNGFPEKHLELVKDMGSYTIFPVDEPPEERVIGPFAYRSLQALRSGDFPEAIAFARQGKDPKAMDWTTAAPHPTNRLQDFFVRLAEAIAWTKNPYASELDCALPELRRLHRDVMRYVSENKINAGHRNWPAWRYLVASTTGYAIAYFIAVIGIQWHLKDHDSLYQRLQQPTYRRHLFRILLAIMRPLEHTQSVVRRDHVAALIAWNLAQAAAVAGREDIFVQCLDALHSKFRKNFFSVLNALRNDDDTRPMLATESVKRFLASLDVPNGHEGEPPLLMACS